MSLAGRVSRLEHVASQRPEMTPSVCFLNYAEGDTDHLTVTELWFTDAQGHIERHRPQEDHPPFDLTRYGAVKVIIGVDPDAI